MDFEMFAASALVGLMSGWPAGIAMKGGGCGAALDIGEQSAVGVWRRHRRAGAERLDEEP